MSFDQLVHAIRAACDVNRKLDFTPSVNCSVTMLNDPRFHPFSPISVLDCRIPGQI